jgi:hypothetical protein
MLSYAILVGAARDHKDEQYKDLSHQYIHFFTCFLSLIQTELASTLLGMDFGAKEKLYLPVACQIYTNNCSEL